MPKHSRHQSRVVGRLAFDFVSSYQIKPAKKYRSLVLQQRKQGQNRVDLLAGFVWRHTETINIARTSGNDPKLLNRLRKETGNMAEDT